MHEQPFQQTLFTDDDFRRAVHHFQQGRLLVGHTGEVDFHHVVAFLVGYGRYGYHLSFHPSVLLLGESGQPDDGTLSRPDLARTLHRQQGFPHELRFPVGDNHEHRFTGIHILPFLP